jgi:hypothetical protein
MLEGKTEGFIRPLGVHNGILRTSESTSLCLVLFLHPGVSGTFSGSYVLPVHARRLCNIDTGVILQGVWDPKLRTGGREIENEIVEPHGAEAVDGTARVKASTR